MKILVIILLFILLFISQINTIVSIDLWWHLKSGEHIIKNLEIPRTDIFSSTLVNKAWIDHEWFTQVIFYLVFSMFGWVGLNVLKALIISLCFFILFYLTSCKFKKNIFPIFFILLSMLTFGYRSFLRPEIFSYLFLGIFFYILETEKRMFLLPFLQIIWVNLHGFFILGPMLILLYIIGEFFSGDRAKAKKETIVLIWVMIACFINPYFYKGALYPFKILVEIFGEQKETMQNITELKMPIMSSFGRFFFFWIFAILTSITFIINLKKAKIRHILIFAVSFIVSYTAARNIPIFIFLGMPVATMNLNEAVSRRISEKRYCLAYAFIILALGYFFLSNRYYIFTNQFGLRKTESKFSKLLTPRGACDFLEDNKIDGLIFNTLDFGPYAGYRFYPRKRIFVDTRTELYKDDFYTLYRRAQNYPEEWHKVHKEYGFEIALLRHVFSGTERVIRYLYKHKDWRLVYYDENSCVFLNNVPGKSEFIKRFEIDFRKKKLEPSDISFNVAGFFQKIGEKELAEKTYIKLLRENPRYLEAGNNLATIYINTDRYEEGLTLIYELLRYYPKSAELYANMGVSYLRLERKEEGFLMLEKAARLDPYLRRASYMLGLVYLEKGDIDRAERQFIKYLRLDPYDAEAHRILGDIYIEKGLLKEAESEYEEADAMEGLGPK